MYLILTVCCVPDSFIHSFIHSYSFNVQVDIMQLQTDREARKEDRIYVAVIVTNQIVMYSYFYIVVCGVVRRLSKILISVKRSTCRCLCVCYRNEMIERRCMTMMVSALLRRDSLQVGPLADCRSSQLHTAKTDHRRHRSQLFIVAADHPSPISVHPSLHCLYPLSFTIGSAALSICRLKLRRLMRTLARELGRQEIRCRRPVAPQ